ncbi:MAG: penicillin-binding transpeptidase domain-containing protein [Bdellovibrionota bacterium]
MKSRIIFLFIAVCGLWILLIGRAFDLQVLPDERLKSLQAKQFQTVVTLQARRGAILDRFGRDLALSTRAVSVYADPKLLDKHKNIAKKIAPFLGQNWQTIDAKIKDKTKRFVWIQRLLSPEEADPIKALGIKGISFVDEWRRVYPNDSLMAQTMGFVGNEGQGLEGIELVYDTELKGAKKRVTVKKDARGRPLLADGLLFTENPDGNDLNLTIDSELQFALENELKGALQEYGAKSAVGIILDAQTSAIRAMASAPSFDPNIKTKADSVYQRNRSISDQFEPGSTMKSFVVAMALHKKLLQPNSKYYCEMGQFKVGDRIVREADSKHKFGFLTVSEILAFSSNIGSAKIAFQLGDEEVHSGLSAFGFGQKIGIDLPGEAKGSVQPMPWNSHLLSNISFGHGVSATALQMANGYAALVNGGILRTPYVVDSIRDPESGEVRKMEPKVIRRVITSEESEKMRLMLMSVTNEGGTGVNARVNGFLVGGKTGTAQKMNPNGKGYLPNSYISSFAGFIPAHQPQFIIYVAVDDPQKAYYGSQVAAPVFSRLASYAARREGLVPLILSGEKKLMMSPESTKLADVTLKPKNQDERTMKVPDLKSLGVREVLREFGGQNIELKFVGSGKVELTDPPAGSEIKESKKITIYLR